MAAPSDNSTETSFSKLSGHIGEGIVIDIGTGDGRFVSAAAKANPAKFYIGIDANVKPLLKPSMKATRRPAKGGLRNALFIQASIEDLPSELNGVGDEIHIHFPWGSLLQAVVNGDSAFLQALSRIAAASCLLEVVFSIDTDRDAAEVKRLGLPLVTDSYIREILLFRYQHSGFRCLECRRLTKDEWSVIETSWAKRLGSNETRAVWYLVFESSDTP